MLWFFKMGAVKHHTGAVKHDLLPTAGSSACGCLGNAVGWLLPALGSGCTASVVLAEPQSWMT